MWAEFNVTWKTEPFPVSLSVVDTSLWTKSLCKWPCICMSISSNSPLAYCVYSNLPGMKTKKTERKEPHKTHHEPQLVFHTVAQLQQLNFTFPNKQLRMNCVYWLASFVDIIEARNDPVCNCSRASSSSSSSLWTQWKSICCIQINTFWRVLSYVFKVLCSQNSQSTYSDGTDMSCLIKKCQPIVKMYRSIKLSHIVWWVLKSRKFVDAVKGVYLDFLCETEGDSFSKSGNLSECFVPIPCNFISNFSSSSYRKCSSSLLSFVVVGLCVCPAVFPHSFSKSINWYQK